MKPKLTTLAALLAAMLTVAAAPAAPAAGAGRAPASFAGMSPQGDISQRDFELMQSSDVSSVRLAMTWAVIQSRRPEVARPEFDGFDHDVQLAAENRIRVMPFLWGTPPWASRRTLDLPVSSPLERAGWARFLHQAERRYGPGGSFWRENRELPYLPIRTWEIWNEQNIVPFSSSTDPVPYARLLRASGRILHRLDPGSKVLIGGLFGRPLQTPPNTASGDFLSRLYRSGDVKRYFDGVALHPYVADAGAMRAQIRNLRRIMRVHGDAGTRLYLTEMGWGSASHESRWERGLAGQARELDRAMSMLVAHRRSWRVGGVWWFSWADLNGSCQFCDSAGLLTSDREAKPSWYHFNAWTGGDPGTVPRASFGGSGKN